ncbi:MAG: radical SAM protein [Atopobiaceae bacterium]|nr:radical SAM protein [Atopobiaceae bacterium]
MNWDEYSVQLFNRCKQLGIPYSACFELTPFCNFSCNMCYVRLSQSQADKQGATLGIDQWINLAKQAKEMGVVNLEVTGGEATLRSDFLELYKAFAKLGFMIILRTNGYRINGKILETLTAYKPYRIAVTLYGASDSTYKAICGIEDGFSVVTKNILAMRDAGHRLSLSMTVTRDNYHEKDALRQWAAENSLAIRTFGGLMTPIRGAKRSIDHLRVRPPEVDKSTINELVNAPRLISDRDKYSSPFWMCRGYGAMFCISWDGRMTLCNSLPAIWSDPLETGISRAYAKLYESLEKLRRPSKCSTCNIVDNCYSCPSRLLSETESISCVNDEICSRAVRTYRLFQVGALESKDARLSTDYDCDSGVELYED